MIQCARQPGLSAVWECLLGFDGAEFYLKTWDEALAGLSFLEASFLFQDAVPLGVRKKSDGILHLNPPNDLIFEVGDELLVLAEDDDTYEPMEEDCMPVLHSKGPIRSPKAQTPERVLFIGWRRDMDALLQALNGYACFTLMFVLFVYIYMLIIMKKREHTHHSILTFFFSHHPSCGKSRCFLISISHSLSHFSSYGCMNQPINQFQLTLYSWVAPGSEVWIFAELSIEERDRRFIEEDFDPSHSENLTIIHSVGDPKVYQAIYIYIFR
jgi:hypothetical protein